jgi:hypothetical protein
LVESQNTKMTNHPKKLKRGKRSAQQQQGENNVDVERELDTKNEELSATMMEVAPRKRRDRISSVVHEEEQHVGGNSSGQHYINKKKKKQQNRRKQSKKAHIAAAEAAEEQRLTNLLFGGGGGRPFEFEQNHDDFVMDKDDDAGQVGGDDDDEEEEVDDEQEHRKVASTENALLFEIDRKGTDAGDEDIDDADEEIDVNVRSGIKRKVNEPLYASSAAAGESDDDGDDDKNRNTTAGAAWVDDDDAQLKVNLLDTSRLRKLRKSRTEVAASALNGVELEERLRQRYQSSDGGGGAGGGGAVRTDWADLQKDADDDDDDDSSKSESDGETKGNVMFNSSVSLLRQPGVSAPASSASGEKILSSFPQQRLPPHTIQMVRCPDANQADPTSAVVQAVHFHPGSDPDRPLVLTAGLDKTLRFFQVGVEKSEKIHGIHCKC